MKPKPASKSHQGKESKGKEEKAKAKALGEVAGAQEGESVG